MRPLFRTRFARGLVILLAVLVVAWLQRHEAAAPDNIRTSPATDAVAKGFDYYVLSLSWSPQHCATDGRGDENQCGSRRQFGLIAHGLWPQYERGYPENCATGSVRRDVVDRMLPIMPSVGLIQHEWRKHGSCAGLAQPDYFDTVSRAYAGFSVPGSLSAEQVRVNTAPDTLRDDILAQNPSLQSDGLVLRCEGPYFDEVRICLNRDLSSRQCGPDLRSNCRGSRLIVRPVR